MLKRLKLEKELKQNRSALEALEQREAEFKTREEQLAAALDEATTEEDMNTVGESIEQLEKEVEEAGIEDKKSSINAEIERIESELADLDERAEKAKENANKEKRKNGGVVTMEKRKLFGMSQEERSTFMARTDVKEFLERTRERAIEKRSVTGADLTIPEVVLDLIRDNVKEHSKLITKVNLKSVKGKARQNVTGTVPEGVWTEMKGVLNELNIVFNQVELDGYKVGGYVALPNSVLEDSDENLLDEIIQQLGHAIGVALDKAIIYGKGTKQPMGIATRLAQTTQPENYSEHAPEWKNLSATHISKTDKTGTALMGAVIVAFGNCDGEKSNGASFHCMSNKTKAYLLSEFLNFNAAGALVSGMNNEMPVIGGDIVTLDFMPDGDIVGGYGDMYLLAEREGAAISASEHAKFIEDMTVVKGVARYDGVPVIAESFYMLNVKNTAVTTAMDFAEDKANASASAAAASEEE